MIYVAIDYAKGDDWNTELYYSYDDKGVITVYDIQRYKQAIDLEAHHDNSPTRPYLPDAG